MRIEKNYKDVFIGLSNLKKEELINRVLHSCLKLNFPMAVWQLPGSDEQHILIEFSHTLAPHKLNISSGIPGFVFSPFLNENNQNSLFIQPDFYYNLKTQQLEIRESIEKESSMIKFLEVLESEISSPLFSYLEKLPTDSEGTKDKQHYTSLVNKSIKAIEENKFKKVVLARHKKITLSPALDPQKIFNNLCLQQANSFVSMVYIPQKCLWTGASPELLVSVNKENSFKTTALAGTQRFNGAEKLSGAVWTQKEIEEQALVNRYIISCFKTIRLREYEEDGPKTVQAGNLIHLKTDFSVQMNEVNFPDLATTMLDLLHPTSAVCGMPKESAIDFIQQYEQLNRKFYSGFLGPVNIAGESHIFVNIRCAEIGNQEAYLYSGAGITSGSNAEKEWEETEIKMKMMEAILMLNRNKM